MLVELDRYRENDEPVEDQELAPDQQRQPQKIAVNPQFVTAVFPSNEHENVTVIRGPDGRGLLIKGAYAEVMAKLNRHETHIEATH